MSHLARFPRWYAGALALVVAVLGFWPAATAAHGGQLRVDAQPAGPYQVSVFTAPTPLEAGTIDLSVIVERPGTSESVEGVEVWVSLEPLDGQARTGEPLYLATAPASGDRFHEAIFELPEPGQWRFTVQIRGEAGEGQVTFDAEVQEAGGRSWTSWLLWGGLGAGGLLAIWWLFAGSDEDEEGAEKSQSSRPRGSHRKRGD